MPVKTNEIDLFFFMVLIFITNRLKDVYELKISSMENLKIKLF